MTTENAYHSYLANHPVHRQRHRTCRNQLRIVIDEVKQRVPPEVRRDAHAEKHGGIFCESGEFCVPDKDFEWYGTGCCAWDIARQGWEAYLDKYHRPNTFPNELAFE